MSVTFKGIFSVLFFMVISFTAVSSFAGILSPEEILEFNQATNNKRDNIKNDNDYLLIAAQKGSLYWVYELLERGADINYYDKTLRTPLLWSFQMGHTDVAKLLISRGADIHSVDQKNHNILFKAVISGNLDLLSLASQHLVKSSLDINIKDNHGKTPFIWSIINRRFEIMKKLYFNFNADPLVVDNLGKDAFYYASSYLGRHPEFLRFFWEQNLFYREFIKIKNVQRSYLQHDINAIRFYQTLLHYTDHSIIDTITKEDCTIRENFSETTIDYSSHFEGEKDQQSFGICWAFAGLSLLEEHLYLQTGKHQSLSIPYFLNETRPELLNFCRTKNIDDGHKVFDALNNFFTGHNHPDQIEDIKDIEDNNKNSHKAIAIANNQASFEEMFNAFDNGEREFILPELHSIPNKDLFYFDNLQVKRVGPFHFDDDLRKRTRSIKHALYLNQRSIAISLNSAGRVHDLTYENTSSAGHALILNGMRWNEDENRCEVHLKNSWGENKTFDGWISAYKILLEMDYFYYLQPKR